MACALIVLVLVLVLFLQAVAVHSSGIGPVGVSVVDARHALVADKHRNALLLVDYLLGRVVSRLDFDQEPRYQRGKAETWPDLVGVRLRVGHDQLRCAHVESGVRTSAGRVSRRHAPCICSCGGTARGGGTAAAVAKHSAA